MTSALIAPDSLSRHHLPFDRLMALSKAEGPFDRPYDRPFDKLTVLSKVEGLTVLSKVEGLTVLSKVEELMTLREAERRRCLRSLLSFDLEALDRLAAYCSIRLSRRSSAPCI